MVPTAFCMGKNEGLQREVKTMSVGQEKTKFFWEHCRSLKGEGTAPPSMEPTCESGQHTAAGVRKMLQLADRHHSKHGRPLL